MITGVDVNALKILLGITTDDKNDLLQFAIDCAEEMILDYCNIDAVPAGLFNTWLRMSVDFYRLKTLGTNELPRVVNSVTEGDVSVSYGDNMSYLSNSTDSGLIDSYKPYLNRYRQVKFNANKH